MASARLTVPALVEAAADIEAIWPGARNLYGQLFGARTSTAEVWRRVRALRIIRAELQKNGTCTTEREKEIAVLGDLLIAHIVFRRLGNDGIDDIASGWDSQLANVPSHVHAALRDLTASVEGKLTKRGAPAPGKGFKRAASVLQDDKWLAKEIERILGSDASASPGATAPSAPWPSAPAFRLPIRGVQARGRRCDGGFLVSAGSMAGLDDWPSLTTPQLRHRRNLRGTDAAPRHSKRRRRAAPSHGRRPAPARRAERALEVVIRASPHRRMGVAQMGVACTDGGCMVRDSAAERRFSGGAVSAAPEPESVILGDAERPCTTQWLAKVATPGTALPGELLGGSVCAFGDTLA
jgi:hypothetical protein